MRNSSRGLARTHPAGTRMDESGKARMDEHRERPGFPGEQRWPTPPPATSGGSLVSELAGLALNGKLGLSPRELLPLAGALTGLLRSGSGNGPSPGAFAALVELAPTLLGGANAPALTGLAGAARGLLAEPGALALLRDDLGSALGTPVATPAPGPGRAAAPDAGLLRGTGGSSRRGTGQARHVTSEPQLPDLAAGDVLVCDAFPVNWASRLPRVAALVCATGSVSAPGMRLARERGIAAVLLRDATRLIPPSATVTVDGVAGTVRVHDA